MSTRCSIAWNETNDYYFHIYHDWDEENYFLNIGEYMDKQIIPIKKEIIEKLIRDLEKGKIKWHKDFAEKKEEVQE